jgi:hypothetical protein
MDKNPFEISPYYEYDIDNMLDNIALMKKTFKSYKFILNNFLDQIHSIYNELLISRRSIDDVLKSIEDFKVSQLDLISNFQALSTQKIYDGKNVINFANHEVSNDNYKLYDYWNEIYPVPIREYTVKFYDGTKISILDIPTIQINLDVNNRFLSLQFLSMSFNKIFSINSNNLSKVIKYLDNNDMQNVDVAIFNLSRFFESILKAKDNDNEHHDIYELLSKFNNVLHDIRGAEKLLKLKKSNQ